MPRRAEAVSSEPVARMVSRPFLQTMTDIPEPIKDYFRSKDLRWNWQRKEEIPNLWGTGCEAFSLNDLPPDLLADTKRYGVKATEEGWIQRHDAILCVIPQAIFDQIQEQEAARRYRTERGYLQDLEEGMDRTSGGRARLHVPHGRKATPRSFVENKKTAADIIADEE